MAELVDAPDSKSGHFGGVGSIPSTPTIFFKKIFQFIFWAPEFAVFIMNSINEEIENIRMPRRYMLNVKPNISADKPTRAGPNITPVNEILVT